MQISTTRNQATNSAKSTTSTQIADRTPPNRNRAIDFYRAISMLVVAIGHWLGMVVVLGDDGIIKTGNALELVPSLWPATWAFQVMPLFFFVGGYASASSLIAASRDGVRAQDWILTRLRRMLAPAAVLAAFWAVALAAGAAVGASKVVAAGAIGAAIPLWFLANYIIDTALAPLTFAWFNRNPRGLVLALGSVFVACEAANLAGVQYLPEVNWVIGWLGFQIAGFAWRVGKLPTGKRLLALCAGLWAAAISAVAFGPWPAPMLHHGGLKVSPTHPPSTAFVLFGLAYGVSAAAGAPALNRWLGRSVRAWRATVAANGIAMSVYLWHMTAAVIVTAAMYATDRIPRVVPGSLAWWGTKPLLVGASIVVLAVIVALVNGVERRALLAPRSTWRGSLASLMLLSAVASASVKMWSSPHVPVLASGVMILLAVWTLGLRRGGGTSPVNVGQ